MLCLTVFLTYLQGNNSRVNLESKCCPNENNCNHTYQGRTVPRYVILRHYGVIHVRESRELCPWVSAGIIVFRRLLESTGTILTPAPQAHQFQSKRRVTPCLPCKVCKRFFNCCSRAPDIGGSQLDICDQRGYTDSLS